MKGSYEDSAKQLFCVLVARGMAPEEAVRRLHLHGGDCLVSAGALLAEGKLRRKIAKLSGELNCGSPAVLARAGLERLALGSPMEGVQLIDWEEGIPTGIDWFHVAEVKRPKGGGVEIKFHDRLRALSLLAQLDNGTADTANSLLCALAESASGMGGEGEADG